MRSFYDWLNAQPEAKGVIERGGNDGDRSGATQHLLKWLRHPRAGRMPKEDPCDFDGWRGVIEKKASKAQKEALVACLCSAWAEWQRSPTFPIAARTKVVESTIARLKTRVWSVEEKGKKEKVSVIAVHEFEGPVARSGRVVRVTKDLGGYDGVQITASLELPSYPEEFVEASKLCQQFCEKEVEIELRRFVESFRVMRTRKGIPESDVVRGEDNSGDSFVEKERPPGVAVGDDDGGGEDPVKEGLVEMSSEDGERSEVEDSSPEWESKSVDSDEDLGI